MALLALFLPFTSFPLVAKLTGSSMVAPLALLPMGAMLLFWLLPYFLRKGSLPQQTKVLMAFLLAALISCIAAFTLSIPPYKNQTIWSQEFEALMTLAVGVGFYLLLSAWLSRSDRLYFLLRWINWSGILMLAWSFIQAATWYKMGTYPAWIWNLQEQFSTSQLLFPQRVNGFAYEPSWLAHQLNMLYLPYWLAATVTRFTAHRFHLGKAIHLENILLVGGLAALFLSFSRVGWLAFLLMVAYLLLLLNLRFVRWAQKSLLKRHAGSKRWEQWIRRWFVVASLLVLLIVYVGLMFGAAYVMGRFDARMAKFFDFSAITDYSFLYYANQLVIAERLVFWQAGWEIFNEYPILGVGLGNAGFFFPQELSAFGWSLTEIRTLVYQWTSLPNIKSLWVRLLSETGIIGFAFFVSWLYVLWKSGRFLSAQNNRLYQMIGMAGAFVLVGFLIESFSVDTFALPYYWITFGLVTAACELARRSVRNPVKCVDQSEQLAQNAPAAVIEIDV
jgi:O-antigen ligase